MAVARIHQAMVGPSNFPACFALLRETFSPAELDEPASMLADLERAATQRLPVQFLLLERSLSPDDAAPGALEQVVGVIAGCYLSLCKNGFAGQGAGFIEYLVTRDEFRHQGHASALLDSFEAALARIAFERGELLSLILGEVDPELVPFKRKRGYCWPVGSEYAQPPIAFDLHSGRPLAAPLPKLLMLKSWVRPLPATLLLSAVAQIFASRYGLHGQGGMAANRASAFIQEQVFAPFEKSLNTRGGMVILN